jgi:hypothetical protein
MTRLTVSIKPRLTRFVETILPAAMVLICLVALVAFLRLPTPAGSAPPVPAAGTVLPGQEVPTLEGRHIPYLGAEHEPYTTVPPTSGPHVPFTVAPGVYREEIADELQVHALEHGHVLIQYAPGTPSDVVDDLEDVARRYPRQVIVAPYDGLTSGIALTAWGRIDRLDTVDRARIDAFVEAFAGRYDHGFHDGEGEDPWWAVWPT